MTLRSLETYGYIGSKTKSYQILKKFLLLFIFYIFWPYKASRPCFLDQQAFLLITFFKPSLLSLSEFFDLFLFCWELLGLCSRVDCVPTIPWIITECLAIYLAAWDFSCSDRINHPTRSMRKTLWKRQHPIVPYLLHPASRAIRHQNFSGSKLGGWSEEGPRLAYSHLRTNCSIIVGRERRRKRRNKSQ